MGTWDSSLTWVRDETTSRAGDEPRHSAYRMKDEPSQEMAFFIPSFAHPFIHVHCICTERHTKPPISKAVWINSSVLASKRDVPSTTLRFSSTLPFHSGMIFDAPVSFRKCFLHRIPPKKIMLIKMLTIRSSQGFMLGHIYEGY